MFIYILFGIAIAALPNVNVSMGPLIQSTGDIEDLDQIVYVNYTVEDNFNYDSFPSLSCCPNNVTKFRVMELNSNGSQIQQFNIPFFIENLDPDPVYVASLTITELFSYQDIETQVNLSTSTPINFGPKQYMTLMFTHFCNKTLDKDIYWSIKTVSLELNGYDPVTFNYQFLCSNNYNPVRYISKYSRFDWSNIILIIAESIIILMLSIFGKIYAFKVVFITKQLKHQLDKEKLERLALESKPFQGFSLSWHQALLYMGLLLGALFISLYLQEKAERPIQIVVYILCCLCTFHFVNELFSSFRKQIPFFVKPILFFRVCDVLSLAIGAALIVVYLIIDQIWIVSYFFYHQLSNLITICILGSLIKLLKIKSLKKSLLFFLPIMAIDIFCSIYLALTIRYEWDSLILRYFNTPLSAQIPYFRYIYKKKCAWVSIFNILFPGFFLAYVHRFDKHKQTLVYEIVSFFGLLIGLVLWVIIQYLTSFPLPTSIFTEVLMILFCSLIAFRRNELNLFWTGDYYDEILYDPFKNELDKKSIKVISFLNMGVSKEVIKKYAVNSQVERVATKYEPFELVKERQPGQLELDSILFEGLYSVNEDNIFDHQPNSQEQVPTNKFSSNPTFDTNQRKDINSAGEDHNGLEEEPLIQKLQSLKRSGVQHQQQATPKINFNQPQQDVTDPLEQQNVQETIQQNKSQNESQQKPQVQQNVSIQDIQQKQSEKQDKDNQETLQEKQQELPKNQPNSNQIEQLDSLEKAKVNQQEVAINQPNNLKNENDTKNNPSLVPEKKSEEKIENLQENKQKTEKQSFQEQQAEKQKETQIQKDKQQEKYIQMQQIPQPNQQQIGRKVISIIDPNQKQNPPPTQQRQQQHVSPVSQKYPINQTAKPQEDRFKQKQQLRAQPQSDVFKKNLEFFQKQEQAQNFKAPVKK